MVECTTFRPGMSTRCQQQLEAGPTLLSENALLATLLLVLEEYTELFCKLVAMLYQL